MEHKRIEWVDDCKGVAILLVVIGHITQSYVINNDFITYRYVAHSITNIIYSFHMPLFFVLSGFIAHKAYFMDKKYAVTNKRLIKQLLNIGYLYLFWSYVHCVVKLIASSNVTNPITYEILLKIPYIPIPPYWYLWVLLWCYIIYVIIRKYNYSNMLIVVFFVLGVIESYVAMYPQLIFKWFFYFYLGTFLSIKGISSVICKIFVFASIIIYILYIYYSYENSFFVKNSLLWNAVAVSGVVIVLYLAYKVKMFNFYIFKLLGKYCLEIYVIHAMIIAMGRTILNYLCVDSIAIYTFDLLVLALSLPIFFAVVMKKMNLYKYIFFPMKLLIKSNV